MAWKNGPKVAQLRFARPTKKLDEVVYFYEILIGLKKIDEFKNHDGFDGVVFGLPGKDYQLEFVSYNGKHSCKAPTKDNLIVLYFESKEEVATIIKKLTDKGYSPVKPENPYWEDISVTFEDPDSWRVVLVFREYS